MDNRNKQLSYPGLYSLIGRLAHKAGLKNIYPYLFRHSQLTKLSQHLTEHELSTFAGWVPGSNMPRVYVHLSGRDLDAKILALNGLKPLEPQQIQESDLKPQACPRCQQPQPFDAKFCHLCGSALSLESAREADDLGEQLSKLLSRPEILEKLAEVLKTCA